MSNFSVKPNTFEAYSPKRISFCLITKNHAPYLQKTIESLLALAKPEDEFIVIDGASTDDTITVMEKYKNRTDIFISEPDVHGSHALNKAVLLGRGKYIKLVTDDDTYYADALDKAAKIMDAHPEIDLLLTGGTKERNGIVWNYWVPPGVNYGKSAEDIFRYKGAAGVGHFVRRSSLARLGVLFPSRPNGDAAFVLEVIRRGGVVKFCRLNTFHHPIYDHSTIIHEKDHVSDTRLLVKEYCPPWFYAYFRLQSVLKPFLRRLYHIYYFLKKTAQGEKEKNFSGKMLWDGGFS